MLSSEKSQGGEISLLLKLYDTEKSKLKKTLDD